ncbi:nuclear factor 7, brain-like [Amblyraja radiata]|uniref:nuclear factor 7, brain-like n=1 Tax=Amblyraja radiata TaxID=386614 RepID=UPI0014029A27|nr:nuclear factor 7, brain-like [Amblyraja radiata]
MPCPERRLQDASFEMGIDYDGQFSTKHFHRQDTVTLKTYSKCSGDCSVRGGYAQVQQLLDTESVLNREGLGVKMASKHQVESLAEETLCPICLDLFTDPVILGCGHNFCRSCITQSWDTDGRNSCPECREEFADRTLKVNRALARLAEKVRTLSLNTEEKESKHHCDEHQEELKLFCETDKKLICVICAAGREHKSHSFIPIKEAVAIYKDQVKSSIQSLTTNKSAIQEMEEQQKLKISQVREQSQSLRSHVTSQFDELFRILVEKKQRILRDIKEDEEKILSPMEKNLQDIQENLNSIEEELSKLQGRMEQTDSVLFLKEEAGRKRRISDEDHTLSLRDGAILDEKFDHPYWLNAVLKDIVVVNHQVSVTLDVETAHARLEVSEDRKRMAVNTTQCALHTMGTTNSEYGTKLDKVHTGYKAQ